MLINFTKVFVCFLLISILSISSIFAAEGDASPSNTNQQTTSSAGATSTENPPANASATTSSANSTSSTNTATPPANASTTTSSANSTSSTTSSTQTSSTSSGSSSVSIAESILNTNKDAPTRRAPVTSISEISNAIDKDYSFLYDPEMKPDLIKDISTNPNNYVIMYLETGDAILIKLREDIAPNTVLRFKQLVQEKYYDDMEIFRAIPDYLVQMGDPSGSGYGGKGVFYFAEISPNEKFQRGTVAMSNNGNLQSDDTQFFITFNSFDWLNGKYTIFGEVVLGMNKLENVNKTLSNDGFVTDPAIITKVELLSDRPTDRIDDLSTIIPVDRKQQAIKKQEENQKKEEAKQAALIENEQQQEAIKNSLEESTSTPSNNTSQESTSTPVDNESASVDEQQQNNSNPYIRPRPVQR